MEPKVLAMYLPQFYKNPDNDVFWGEGFTDWISARNAKTLFEGHYQPHVPLNGNYYNLLDKEVMKWQAALMHEYGGDGICMHHYWFKDGRRSLEKPEQNLLEWKEIDMPFCFCWANESWAKSWSNVKGANAWVDTSEDGIRSGDGILLQQDYGSREEWVKHFDYLLPFFRDDRYIKQDGKPVFLIYKANDIDCLREMLECWRQLAKNYGLSGIYVIGSSVDGIEDDILDSCLYMEPRHAIGKAMEALYQDGLTRLSYTNTWDAILSEVERPIHTCFGGYVGYDDTPRRGLFGKVVENSTPELFGGFLAELIAKNVANGNDLVFINAWNEWGEGMHLEPDEKYGFKFLEKIREAKANYKELVPFYTQIKRKNITDRNEKHELYLNDLDIWMQNKENGANIGKWLLANGYKNVAVYGYGIMGRHLIAEIQATPDVVIKYIVEKRKQTVDYECAVFYPDEDLPSIDLLIVSSYYYWTDIVKNLPKELKIVSLREILYEINNDIACYS